jgi:hypothetical protein
MPKLGLGLSLPQTKRTSFDSDARAYIAAVEAADGQALESGVKTAINTFVVGLKSDGLWNSIVTSCIMAGARTVAGAIIPLKGNAPTNNNFVIGDYSRTLGLLGNDSNKNLATGYNNNDTTNFPQDDTHISCYVSVSATDTTGVFVGTNFTTGNRFTIAKNGANTCFFQNRSSTNRAAVSEALGFQGSTRNNSTNFTSRATRVGGIVSEVTTAATSGTPISALLGVFAGYPTSTPSQFIAARMSFYSIGKSLTLSLLDSRVTTLMNTLASVIP